MKFRERGFCLTLVVQTKKHSNTLLEEIRNAMKYGMNLLLWSGEVTDDVLQVCGKLKEIGYDGVELPIFNLDLDYSAIGSELDSLGLGRTGVTVRGEEDNPISPDAAVRAKGIELSKKTLDCCRRRVETLVGPYHSALGLFSGAGPMKMSGSGVSIRCGSG